MTHRRWLWLNSSPEEENLTFVTDLPRSKAVEASSIDVLTLLSYPMPALEILLRGLRNQGVVS